MKVDPTHANRITPKQTGNTDPVEKSLRTGETDARADALTGKDRASLSERARLLAKMHTQLDETPEVREYLVNELRSQVNSGQYQIPIEKLAHVLVSRFKE